MILLYTMSVPLNYSNSSNNELPITRYNLLYHHRTLLYDTLPKPYGMILCLNGTKLCSAYTRYSCTLPMRHMRQGIALPRPYPHDVTTPYLYSMRHETTWHCDAETLPARRNCTLPTFYLTSLCL